MEDQKSVHILEAMRLGTAYRHPVKVRGFTVMMRPLSIAEKRMVASLVVDELKKLPASAQNAMSEQTIYAELELYYASTSKPDALDPQLTREAIQAMTTEELLSLFRQYNGVCEKLNPTLEKLPRERVEELAAEIKKNPTTLTELSLMELVNVCRFFAENSLMDKSVGL